MKNTKLKSNVVESLDNREMTLKLALNLGIGQRMVEQHLESNKPYGRLTWMDALEAISDLLGIEIMDLIESDEPVSVEV
ncbi:MAG: hypothetical protein ACTHLE_04400 [Agriterribacter sp.]